MYASSNHSVGIAKTSYEAQTSKYKKSTENLQLT